MWLSRVKNLKIHTKKAQINTHTHTHILPFINLNTKIHFYANKTANKLLACMYPPYRIKVKNS